MDAANALFSLDAVFGYIVPQKETIFPFFYGKQLDEFLKEITALVSSSFNTQNKGFVKHQIV